MKARRNSSRRRKREMRCKNVGENPTLKGSPLGKLVENDQNLPERQNKKFCSLIDAENLRCRLKEMRSRDVRENKIIKGSSLAKLNDKIVNPDEKHNEKFC